MVRRYGFVCQFLFDIALSCYTEEENISSKYEELLESLVKVIEERSDIVQQVEQERQMCVEHMLVT